MRTKWYSCHRAGLDQLSYITKSFRFRSKNFAKTRKDLEISKYWHEAITIFSESDQTSEFDISCTSIFKITKMVLDTKYFMYFQISAMAAPPVHTNFKIIFLSDLQTAKVTKVLKNIFEIPIKQPQKLVIEQSFFA